MATALFAELQGPPALRVSALELDVLCDHLGIEVPLVLRVPSPGRTDRERRDLVDRAWASLGERGLGRPVDLDARLERLLRLLVRPDREVDGRLWHGAEVRVLAAATGPDAVLATLTDDGLTLVEADATGLPRQLVGALPPLGPGPGRSVTLPSSVFEDAAAVPAAQFPQALRERGVRADDATALGEMISEVVGHGRIGVAVRDRWGKRHRAPRVVSYFDTPQGRYLQTRLPSPDGSQWTTVSPATAMALQHQVSRLLGSYRD
ncbi:ESX secretion-associated protein EspG [Actinokineospora bangkokensis]|uniref:ESX secretion-associated protein EspG n=1 Tax=Actinokineospora bangkokensis TaxID=1193682 RepID=A0A1Q9LEM7_9PSEU|nr:ESX secretion-associated protein EspG [Actinokineospora bangkokensis]OLR90486.1 hypothetical protein BJP25_28025 [Actinokineospora bangkokensis]